MKTSRSLALVTAAFMGIACAGAPTDPPAAGGDSPAPALNASDNGVVASATGSAHRIRVNVEGDDELWVLAFSAVKRADGTTTGNARIDRKDLGISWNLEVTCLTVVGNTAWIGGIIRNARGPIIQEGTVSYFYVIDNGEGADAPPDIASAIRINDLAGRDQEFCNIRPLALPPSPIAHGNIQVH